MTNDKLFNFKKLAGGRTARISSKARPNLGKTYFVYVYKGIELALGKN